MLLDYARIWYCLPPFLFDLNIYSEVLDSSFFKK